MSYELDYRYDSMEHSWETWRGYWFANGFDWNSLNDTYTLSNEVSQRNSELRTFTPSSSQHKDHCVQLARAEHFSHKTKIIVSSWHVLNIIITKQRSLCPVGTCRTVSSQNKILVSSRDVRNIITTKQKYLCPVGMCWKLPSQEKDQRVQLACVVSRRGE